MWFFDEVPSGLFFILLSRRFSGFGFYFGTGSPFFLPTRRGGVLLCPLVFPAGNAAVKDPCFSSSSSFPPVFFFDPLFNCAADDGFLSFFSPHRCLLYFFLVIPGFPRLSYAIHAVSVLFPRVPTVLFFPPPLLFCLKQDPVIQLGAAIRNAPPNFVFFSDRGALLPASTPFFPPLCLLLPMPGSHASMVFLRPPSSFGLAGCHIEFPFPLSFAIFFLPYLNILP